MKKLFFQVSGIVSMIGGASLGLYQILHPNRDAHSVLNSPYSLIHDLGILAVDLILFAVIGLYLSIEDRLGKSGLISFIIVILGSALESGILWVDSYLNPGLPHLFQKYKQLATVRVVYILFYLFSVILLSYFL